MFIKFKRFFVKILLILLLPTLVFASGERLSNVGTTAASFMEVGIGARAVSMGGAFVAVANDASCMYWNPAGMSRLKGGEFLFEHIDWFADVSFDHISTVIPLGNLGAVGAFITSVAIPRMKVRTREYADGTGEYFNAANLVFGMSYARNLTDRFSIGFNGKYISERIWHEQATSIAIDIGTLYYTGIGSLVIGATISNFGSSMQMDGSDLIIYHDTDPLIDGNNDRIMGKKMTDEWSLPLNMQFGISYKLIDNRMTRITLAADALHPINNSESVNAGLEWAFYNTLFLRGGFKAIGQEDSEEGFTIGGGINYKLFGSFTIRMDYAYADFGRLAGVQRYTLFLQF